MITDKIITPKDIPDVIAQNKIIVFTNGCFDIIHAGHVQYLEQAKQLGEILIIGLNSDASVKRLKGSNRPINNELDRAVVMAALAAVDYVIVFTEDTPYELVKLIQPDVLVKGGDWAVDNIVGADIVFAKSGKVLSLPYKEGLSSTNLIKAMGREI